jgi:putative membrane protein
VSSLDERQGAHVKPPDCSSPGSLLRASVFAILAAAGPILAQTAGPAPSAASQPSAAARIKLAQSDADFLKQAAEAGAMEVEAGKIAVAKAVNTQVRGFGQQMVDEHGKANAELSALAIRKGIDVPAAPSLAQATKIKLLSSRDGAGFDRSYAQTFGVRAHRDALDLFQKAADHASDPEIKAFAAKALPALEQHFEMAKEMQDVVEKEGNAKAASDRKQ